MAEAQTQIDKINNIWMVTREYDTLAGVGGVKDVSRQLSEALAQTGRRVNVIMPLYGFIDPNKEEFKPLGLTFDIDMPYVGMERRERVTIWVRKQTRVTIYLAEAQRYKEKRSIYAYTTEEEAEDADHKKGTGHYDYFAMNVLLQKAAIALMICLSEKPDIIHCHDGHTALLPAMIREIEGYRHYFQKTGTVVTIHNAGTGYHQEIGDLAFAQTVTGLPSKLILENKLNGSFDPLLAASTYAKINTVSENYARELRETDADGLTGWLGHKLISRDISLGGITNGINPKDFDLSKPEKLGLPASYSPGKGDFTGKAVCREHFIKTLIKKRSAVTRYGTLDAKKKLPLFTLIGRFTEQKGVDKLLGALEALLPMDKKFQVAILGTGTAAIKIAQNKTYKGRVCLLLGFDSLLANQIYAAGDFFLVPSMFEPCGLTDYIAQLFGNIPIVHHIGGLVKVIDDVTGFAYKDHSSASLMAAMQRAIKTFHDDPKKINRIRKTAVQNIHKQYTWEIIVNKYIDLYGQALALTE
jgi:starch synthase